MDITQPGFKVSDGNLREATKLLLVDRIFTSTSFPVLLEGTVVSDAAIGMLLSSVV